MNPSRGEPAVPEKEKDRFFKAFLAKLRKRHIIETLAAFIGGGWLILEFVDRLLVAHYHFPDETIDLTFITILAALICTILWRWFRGTEKRPGNVKVEVLLVPLVILTALCIDFNILFDIGGISGKRLLIGIIALGLGIAWIIFKSLQWAAISPAITPGQAKREIEISPPATVKTERSIVVLPFKNISPEEGQEYFSDGMTEEITTKLSKVLSLRVISRTSAFMFKDTSKNIRDIAQELNVGYVLEGSVRKAGNKLRIAAQLIDAAIDAHIWADTYDGILEDVFDIQENVSQSIVTTLKLKLTPEEKQRIYEKPIDNVTAYECYLRAYHEILGFSAASLDRAVRYLQDSLDIIGDNALIYSTMAYVYWQYVNIGIRQEEYIARAEEYVKKALTLDPESPQAHTVLGAILIAFRGNQRDGVRHLKKALASNPEDPMPLLQLAVTYIQAIGKLSLAAPLVQRILHVDPLNSIGHLCEAALVLYEGKYELALEASRRAYQIDPENPISQFFYSWTLAYNNKIEDALSRIDQMEKESPDVSAKLGLLLKYGLLKDKEKAFQVMTADFQKTCKRDPEWSHYVGVMLSLLDAKKEALDWLENAVNQGLINYPALKHDAFLANIRGEERFKRLMERVKYEWEHFEV
jgi:TolB-like protein/Tfp pilus assembly protein PilF